jgi:hypothetical protein
MGMAPAPGAGRGAEIAKSATAAPMRAHIDSHFKGMNSTREEPATWFISASRKIA